MHPQAGSLRESVKEWANELLQNVALLLQAASASLPLQVLSASFLALPGSPALALHQLFDVLLQISHPPPVFNSRQLDKAALLMLDEMLPKGAAKCFADKVRLICLTPIVRANQLVLRLPWSMTRSSAAPVETTP